jgi:D-glycero-D-manno-heptose 1,7-bisphosphate phosphatase
MKLVLLDRDGVVVVNRSTNIKQPSDLALIDGASEGIRTLNEAGYTVAICTNQPEVGRRAMSLAQLENVHAALEKRLYEQGAQIDRIFSCTSLRKCPRRKPAGLMLKEALAHYGARAADTPFIGDQADDLKAAFHAGCRRILVRTGLGTNALSTGIADYVKPFGVADNLLAAARDIIRSNF